ncbi:MAG: tetratricopeptide repeat protein [Microscillaceae bacterium]|nr:tetratricopeptide repeat protein [Microscillaceae bacterium]
MTANIHFLSGLEHAKQEKYQEAIALFTKSLHLQPQHTESYFNRALAYYKLGDFKNALMDFDESLKLTPKNAEIYHERAITHHKLANHRQALEDLNKALWLDPYNPYRYSSRAYIRAFVGDTHGAIEDYQKALELDPQDAVTLNNLGLLEEKLGYKKEAQERFDLADQIADQGKTFEKPKLEEILQQFEARQQARLEAERLLKQPKGNGETSSSTADKPSIYAYWKVIKEVFSSRDTFREFVFFLKQAFQKNK